VLSVGSGKRSCPRRRGPEEVAERSCLAGCTLRSRAAAFAGSASAGARTQGDCRLSVSQALRGTGGRTTPDWVRFPAAYLGRSRFSPFLATALSRDLNRIGSSCLATVALFRMPSASPTLDTVDTMPRARAVRAPGSSRSSGTQPTRWLASSPTSLRHERALPPLGGRRRTLLQVWPGELVR
jgi:hypothetical protein